jgi:transposase
VADRWHLWHNLAEAVERIVARNAASLRPPAEPVVPVATVNVAHGVAAATANDTPPGLAARIRERHGAVHELVAAGCTIKQIAARLDLARNTVRRYARASTPEALMTGQWQAGRPRMLDPVAPYLLQRLAEGQSNATRLYEEIVQLGYQGSLSRLRSYLRPLRAGHPSRRREAAPSVRTVTSWLTRHPDRLETPHRDRLAGILQRCPDLHAAAGHVRTFAEMMRERAGSRLNAWMRTVREDALPELHSFVAGIEQDYDAVLAALTLPYSSGVVEGHVNRIKVLKRQMYGRASFPLLRARVLQAT